VTDPLGAITAILIAGLLNTFIVAAIQRRAGEPAFLRRVYTATLALRAAIAFGLNLSGSQSAVAAMFWGDSGTYDIAGDLLARSWHGEPTSIAPQTEALSGYGFVYYVAALYFAFGRNQLLVQLLNATIGSATVLVVYAIASRLYGAAVARWAALFMAFFPQMLFWSGGMYKDPTILLCIAVCMYGVLRLRERFSFTPVLLAGLVLLTLRFYVFYFVVAAAVGTFVFGGKGNLGERLVSFAVLTLVLAGALTFGLRQETFQAQAGYMTFEQIQVTRSDQATWGRSAYGTEYDVTTPAGALRALPVGLVYLLFAPFPWAITSVRQLLVLPETLAWYALMPAFARGLAYSIRVRLRDVLPILVFAVTLTLAYALMQGTIGTAYRQRTQVTMFYFVFMAVGVVQRRGQR
jgi:4-amino-4-deoxy-L-arabinose transferase-like glycosyltransferase